MVVVDRLSDIALWGFYKGYINWYLPQNLLNSKLSKSAKNTAWGGCHFVTVIGFWKQIWFVRKSQPSAISTAHNLFWSYYQRIITRRKWAKIVILGYFRYSDLLNKRRTTVNVFGFLCLNFVIFLSQKLLVNMLFLNGFSKFKRL